MEIFEEFKRIENLSLALGFFDGVHLAHKKVIQKAYEFAKENGKKSAVVTFKNHPRCYFANKSHQYLLSNKDRIEKISELKVDFLFLLEFDKKMQQLSHAEYLDNIIKNFSPIAITTGFNHFFGRDKKGDKNFLEKASRDYPYKYFKIAQQKIDNETISSTFIKNRIENDRFDLANRMLGYKFYIESEVIEGQKLGRTLGFRTANIVYPDNIVKISRGVFRVNIILDGKKYTGIANFGTRPTIVNSSNQTEVLEVHIFNFSQNIYGKKIRVEFVEKIREEKKFDSKYDLIQQIKKDISIQFIKQI